jgi:D-alanyl-D-alanine endopeptidase (penicillin-binding protein 7)
MVRSLAVLPLILGALAGSASADGSGDSRDSHPTVKSRAAVVLDAATGAELYAKHADEVRPIASTTKIFVAMAVRRKGLDLGGWTQINRVDAAEAKGGARTRLELGESFRNKDLLRAMLIASDNRAPTALGRAAGMDPDALVDAMNGVAKRLKLKHTHFTDPSGLHGNTSTAREMAIALRAALEDGVLREIMGEDHYQVRSKDGLEIYYGTTNRPLAAKRFDVIGGKTGYTEKAGYCYITEARFDTKSVVMSFLGADEKQTRFADFDRVAEWLESRHVTKHVEVIEDDDHGGDDDDAQTGE